MMNAVVHQINQKVLDAVSMASNQTSAVVELKEFSLFCVQYVITGFSATTATLDLQASNDGINYVSVQSITPTLATENDMINVEKAGYNFVRVQYTQTGGAGTLTVIINGKVL